MKKEREWGAVGGMINERGRRRTFPLSIYCGKQEEEKKKERQGSK